MSCSKVMNVAVSAVFLAALIVHLVSSFVVGWVDVSDDTSKAYLGVYNYCASTYGEDGLEKHDIKCESYTHFYHNFIDNCVGIMDDELSSLVPDYDAVLRAECKAQKEALKEHGFPPEGVKHMQPLATWGFVSALLFLFFFCGSLTMKCKSVPRFLACTALVTASVLGAITMSVCKSEVLDSPLAIYLTEGFKGKLSTGFSDQATVIALYGVTLIMYVISWFITPPKPTAIAYTRVVTQVNQPLVPIKVANNYQTQPAYYVNPQGFTQPLLSVSTNSNYVAV